MHARLMMIPLTVAVAAVVSGCASTGAPEPVAKTDSQECKVVAVYSASDVLRNQDTRGVPGSGIAKAEGAAEAGRVESSVPLRTPSRLDSMPAQIARNC